MTLREFNTLTQEEKIDWALTYTCVLKQNHGLAEDDFTACIDQLCKNYGTEYIANRMVALGLA